MPQTITEALAEIKTIQKRVEKKRQGMRAYLARQEGVKDPLAADGGSVAFIASERQAVADLNARIVRLRRGIAAANDATSVTINGVTRTVSEWLTWRRDVAPGEQGFLSMLRTELASIRTTAKRNSQNVVASESEAKQATDIVVNVNESALATEIDALEDTLGQLDGQLSLKNATVMVAD